LEIIWQLNESDKEHLRLQKKGSFFPTTTKFSNFWTRNKDALDQIDTVLEAYKMGFEDPRIFDLEGFINRVRLGIKRPQFIHQVLFDEDVVRNCATMEEIHLLRQKWREMMEGERMITNINPAYPRAFVDENDPIIRIQRILAHAETLIESAPAGEERPTYARDPKTPMKPYGRGDESPESPPAKKLKIIDLEHEEKIEFVDLEEEINEQEQEISQ